MKINPDSLAIFIIVWGIQTCMVVRAYLKLNSDDKKAAMNDFRSRQFIFTILFIIIGAFVAHLGVLLSVSIIELIGIVFFILGGIFSTLNMWKKSKSKSISILIIVSSAIFISVI